MAWQCYSYGFTAASSKHHSMLKQPFYATVNFAWKDDQHSIQKVHAPLYHRTVNAQLLVREWGRFNTSQCCQMSWIKCSHVNAKKFMFCLQIFG